MLSFVCRLFVDLLVTSCVDFSFSKEVRTLLIVNPVFSAKWFKEVIKLPLGMSIPRHFESCQEAESNK